MYSFISRFRPCEAQGIIKRDDDEPLVIDSCITTYRTGSKIGNMKLFALTPVFLALSYAAPVAQPASGSLALIISFTS